MTPLRQIRKRDGRLVPFERAKIADAIFRAAQAVGGEDRFLAEQLAGVVEARVKTQVRGVPSIEDVQDAVEKVLIEAGHARTAKTFILYRDRRGALRRAARRVGAPVPAPAGAQGPEAPAKDLADDVGHPPEELDHAVHPLVCGPNEADVARFDKRAIVAALRAQSGVRQAEAEAIARAVEARVLRSGRARIERRTLQALIDAERFDRGIAPPLPASRPGALEAWLDGSVRPRRTPNPGALAEAIGEQVLEEHLLDQVFDGAVTEAHRVGDLHLYDLGAPHRLTGISLDAVALGEAALGESWSSTGRAARRACAALELIVQRHIAHAARLLTLDHVACFLAPFLHALDEEALRERVRELLTSPAFRGGQARSGRVRVELTLRANMPHWLTRRPVPAPAAPGRCYGEFEDDALRVLRAFLSESAALHAAGHWVEPVLTLIVQRTSEPDATLRAVLRDVLRAARETGEPLLVLEEADAPTRGCRWLRHDERAAPDPLRFTQGDVTVASVTALNLVAAALRTRAGGAREFTREVERLLGLALDAAAARGELLGFAEDDPGGPLWALRRGEHPLVDLEAAVHGVQLVGLRPAVALIVREGSERRRLQERVVACVTDTLARQSRARQLRVQVLDENEGEAAARFARIDAERFPEVAGWWSDGGAPSYRAADRGEAPSPAEGFLREMLPPRGADIRLRRRIQADKRPPLETLLRDVVRGIADPRVAEIALDPWPRRLLRRRDEPASRMRTS